MLKMIGNPTENFFFSESSVTETVEEVKKEEEISRLQPEQSEPVINSENKEIESENQSDCSSSNQSTESETDQSNVGSAEHVDQSRAAVQNEAEAEEMESSSDENTVISSVVSESEVKESDEICSSEHMDVDLAKSEPGDESGEVTTSNQETEEPMDQE